MVHFICNKHANCQIMWHAGNVLLSPDWSRLGDREECVWGSLAAAAGILPDVNEGCQGSSRGPTSCWRVTPNSAAGNPAPACPAFSGPAGLWRQAGCCSSFCRRSDGAAERKTVGGKTFTRCTFHVFKKKEKKENIQRLLVGLVSGFFKRIFSFLKSILNMNISWWQAVKFQSASSVLK